MSKNFIPVHDGYAKLKSYQKSEIIYDATTNSATRKRLLQNGGLRERMTKARLASRQRGQ